MKKLTSFLCAVTLILSAVSCGKNPVAEEQKPVETPVVTQLLYKSEQHSIPDDLDSHISMSYTPNKGTGWLYKANSDFVIQYYDENLNETEKIKLMSNYDCQSFYGSLDSNGNAHILLIYGDYDGDPTDYEKYLKEAKIRLEIHSFDENGTKTEKVEIENAHEYFDLATPIDDIIYHDGKYIITSPMGYYTFDENGQLLNNAEESGISFTTDSQGKLVCSKWDDYCYMGENMVYSDNGTKFGEYVKRTGKLFTGVGAYAFFGIMQQGIYGITADGQVIQLMDFVGSRVMSNEIYDVAYVGEGQFMAYTVSNLGTKGLLNLTVRPDDYEENRQKFILGYEGTSSYATELATQFNKTSDKFEAEAKIYREFDDLRAAVLTNEAPDVFMYDDADLIQQYTNIGAFADMYELMDEYGGITKDDLMPNILEAMEYKGGLYGIPDSFDVTYNIAWSEVLDREYSNWTTEEFLNFMETMPEDTYFGDMLAFLHRNEVFNFLCADNVEQWVDFDNGTCDFESESFIKMLTLSRDLKIRNEDMTAYEYASDEEMIAESEYNSTLLKKKEAFLGRSDPSMHFLGSPTQCAYYGLSLDECTLVSPPLKNGGGIIRCNHIYSVLNCGDCTEGGWEFMKYILGDSYQEQFGQHQFVVNKDMFYKTTKQQQVSSPGTTASGTINGYSYEYDPSISEEQYDYIIGFIEKCTTCGGNRYTVRAILDEEFTSFVAGETTAEECAKRIQGRIEIYLSENT